MSQYPKAKFIISANHPKQFVGDLGAEVAFSGRSNSGKSSAINVIVNRRQFARTSKTPGRTQLINFFNLKINVSKNSEKIIRGINLLRLGNNPVKISEKDILNIIS